MPIIIRRSKIQDILVKEREKERKIADEEWKDKIRRNEARLKGEYELNLQQKDADIERLNSMIHEYKEYLNDADDKNAKAKTMLLAAQQIATELSSEVNKIFENFSKSQLAFTNIKEKAMRMTKKFVPEITE